MDSCYANNVECVEMSNMWIIIGVFLLGVGILNKLIWFIGVSVPFLMIGLMKYNYNQAKMEHPFI